MRLDEPIVPRSLVDEAFERIVNSIVLGDFAPGERLREAQLSRSLGISRGVLREAMQRLEGLNLVRRTSNIGVHVVGLSDRDLFELFTMREALEGMAGRLAAENITDDEIEALRAMLDRHGSSRELKTGDGYIQYSDDDFHLFIAKASRNARLERILSNELYYQLRLYRYRSSTHRGRAKEALREHQAIVDAICDRDPDMAEAAIRTHLRNARLNLRWTEAPKPTKRSRAATKVDASQDDRAPATIRFETSALTSTKA